MENDSMNTCRLQIRFSFFEYVSDMIYTLKFFCVQGMMEKIYGHVEISVLCIQILGILADNLID